MFETLSSQIAAVAWVGVCAFALIKGEQAERSGGGALLVGWIGTLAVQREVGYANATLSVMAIDIVLLLVLLGLSWKSDRSWPIWGAAFQLITVLVHIVTLADLRIGVFAHLSAVFVATYGLLACLAVGTFWAWQEREAIKPRE